MTYYPVWRFRGPEGRIVQSEEEDAAARAEGFLPADREEADPTSDAETDDAETEEPKRRRRKS